MKWEERKEGHKAAYIERYTLKVVLLAKTTK